MIIIDTARVQVKIKLSKKVLYHFAVFMIINEKLINKHLRIRMYSRDLARKDSLLFTVAMHATRH